MPGTLTQLMRNRARVNIPLSDGSSIYIDYRITALTPRLKAEFTAAQSGEHEEAALDLVTRFLTTVVIDWDLLDEAGQPIPPTAEGLQDVDYEAQMILFNAIWEHMQLGKPTGTPPSTPSASPSSPTATQATSRRSSRTGSR